MNRNISASNKRMSGFVALLVTMFVLMLTAPTPLFARVLSDRVTNFGQPYEIVINGGPVTLKLQGANTIHVRMVEHALPAEVKVGYTEVAGKLTVTVHSPVVGAATTNPGQHGEIVLRMPRYEFVYAKNTSGDILVDNMSTVHLNLATETGRIDVQGTNAVLVASSTSGPQTYRDVYGSLTASSISAPIAVNHEVGLVHLSSVSGPITGTNILLQTTSSFKSKSGDISVALWNNLYGCNFSLRSNSGAIQLGQIHRKKELYWGRGKVSVTGVTTTGSMNIQ